jgi:hypothetical protein
MLLLLLPQWQNCCDELLADQKLERFKELLIAQFDGLA